MGKGRKRGRGRLSKIDLLPEECDGIIVWAAGELIKNDRTQTEIYGEFKEKLIGLQGELGLGFDIPSFSSFNRYSTRKAATARAMSERREIYAALSDDLSAKDSDDLTVWISEAMKTLIANIAEEAINGRGSASPNDLQSLSNAFFKIEQGRNLSGRTRRTDEDEVNKKLGKAIDTAAKKVGLSGERVAQLRREFLGVRKQQVKEQDEPRDEQDDTPAQKQANP